MVQVYGATQPRAEDGDDVRAGDLDPSSSGEGDALLGPNATTRKAKKRDGHATLMSSVSNLANTIIGSGE